MGRIRRFLLWLLGLPKLMILSIWAKSKIMVSGLKCVILWCVSFWPESRKQFPLFVASLLGYFEILIMVILMIGLSTGIAIAGYRWWDKENPPLDKVMELFTKNWQGVLVIMLIMILPTIRNLAERIVEGFGLKFNPTTPNQQPTQTPLASHQPPDNRERSNLQGDE